MNDIDVVKSDAWKIKKKKTDKNKLTDAQRRALEILKDTSYLNPMQSRDFAEKMWKDNSMHRKCSNTGNGATRGKAAWLCGGSYLRKLEKMGFVYSTYKGYRVYFYITELGKQHVKENV